MATVVKLGNATAALNLFEGFHNRVQHPQSCNLQNRIISLRPAQRIGSPVASPFNSHGNGFLKCTMADIQIKAMALPIDRKSREDNGNEAELADVESGEFEEPWLGALMFKRSNHRNHYEFHTSLERLGLGKLSSESSRDLAKSMGLNAASAAPSTEDATPVSISIDVSREDDRRDLRLDGVVRTTVTLCCNR
jgi:hypothetical protein